MVNKNFTELNTNDVIYHEDMWWYVTRAEPEPVFGWTKLFLATTETPLDFVICREVYIFNYTGCVTIPKLIFDSPVYKLLKGMM